MTESEASRYVVGIDLGTTNTAVCFVDTEEPTPQVRVFAIQQITGPGEVEALPTLGSFALQSLADESTRMTLPWQGAPEPWVVGAYARSRGAQLPGRLISSAKSWLCHGGIDRTAAILPWHGDDAVERMNPTQASALYLRHLVQAWNDHHRPFPLAEQTVVLAVPASFDEVARELTVAAAKEAGLQRVILLEEPQAAFYAWVDRHRDNWHQQVHGGELILVCDIGGGTTDLSLIQVRGRDDGKVAFHRVAVGDHLMLGGDNLDLALARFAESQMAGVTLTPRQWGMLVRQCSVYKETLLCEQAPDSVTVSIDSGGSRLIGGAIQVALDRDRVRQILVDGFFPNVALSARPQRHRSGIQEFGLPYAPDPAVTRYLAAFLSAHRQVQTDDLPAARPDVVLFNGGVFASPILQQRMVEVIGAWFSDQGAWQPRLLEHDRLDLAVARGAAYFGLVRRGLGERIVGGLARSYYIEVATGSTEESQAICLMPAGAESGVETALTAHPFQLLIRRPVEFGLYVSSVRTTDQPGDLIEVDLQQMTALPAIRTVLRSGKRQDADVVDVCLHARLTEIGTLDIWFEETRGDRRWRLQFDIRSSVRTDLSAHESDAEQQGVVDESIERNCRALIFQTFIPAADDGKSGPEGLLKRLEKLTEMRRRAWPASLLRSMWSSLMEVESVGRRRSDAHEARWLNMAGYTLRPGFGLAVDDWRVDRLWKLYQHGVVNHRNELCRAEWWIMWRRVCGGLTDGRQRTLAEPLLATLRSRVADFLAREQQSGRRQSRRGKGSAGRFKFTAHEAAELWRLLGSLEHLPVSWKLELGDALLLLAAREKTDAVREACCWAWGRVAARVPVYGPINQSVGAEQVGRWLEQLMAIMPLADSAPFAAVLAARKTGDRFRDIDPSVRDRVVAWLGRQQSPAHYMTLVRDGGELDAGEQVLVLGESLVHGLRLL